MTFPISYVTIFYTLCQKIYFTYTDFLISEYLINAWSLALGYFNPAQEIRDVEKYVSKEQFRDATVGYKMSPGSLNEFLGYSIISDEISCTEEMKRRFALLEKRV